MNLDDLSAFQKIDAENMIVYIDALPEQFGAAWRLGQEQPLPDFHGVKTILVTGMGGSAIGGDLVSAFVEPHSSMPVIVHRNYGLPAWAQGPETLVVACSHSGDTEETLSAFEQARSANCRLLTISTGGKLSQAAQAAGVPAWHFEHHGQPRAAVGYSFGLLLAVIARLNLIPDPTPQVESTVAAMRQVQSEMQAGVPVAKNPAKRLAGQLHGRWVTIMAADFLAPVARRWKTQINEVAKAWAQFEFLPEADHNTMAGLLNPEKVLKDNLVIFLRAPSDHPRNSLRLELTRKGFLQEGLNTDYVDARGENPLEHMWTTLLMGDYVAYYLAMSYEVDPTPVEAIQGLKAEMRG